MFGPACACNTEPIPAWVVVPPTPVVPAFWIPCCSNVPRPATLTSGTFAYNGFSAALRAISINSILRSSIPGASLTNWVVVSGCDPPPPPLDPPPPKYCLNPVSSLMVPAPPYILRSLDSNSLMWASSLSPLIPFPEISL